MATTPEPSTTSATAGGFLAGVRVLDFADASGRYASRLLADLGADVIRVIGPGVEPLGPPPRAQGPHGEASFFDRFVAINSRVVKLDALTAAGRELLERLLRVSDLIIDTPDEHGFTAHGLDAEELSAVAPRLSRLSVRSFGTDGPKSSIAADELTVLAASGLLSLGGYPDAGPVAVAGYQSYLGRSIYGVVGSLLVLLQGRKDGRGRHVEVSGQEVMAGALEDTVAEYDFNGHVRGRLGGVPRGAGTGTFPCSDGYVSMVAGRLGTAKAWASLVRWLIEEGVPGAEEMAEPAWSEYEYRAGPEATAIFTEIFARFGATQTKEQLYVEGQRRQIPIAPVNSARDVLDNEQLRVREFFHQLHDPELDETLTVPGRPYRSSALDRVPLTFLSATTDEVLTDVLGLSDDELSTYRLEEAIP